MKKNAIANGDLQVSPICLGTMTFGTPVGEKDAIDLTHWAIDHGINFIDTANIYEGYARVIGSAGGVAEVILGKALRNRRSQVVLATKVGMKVGAAPEDEGTSPAAIAKQLDKSLQRLDTDCIDIYYLHKPDPQTPLEDIVGSLSQAIQAGKIRHYGLSNYSAEQTGELLRVADNNSLPHPVIHQPSYSLLKRDAESELLPLCAREGIAVAPYWVLQGGLLTGKYRRGHAPPSDSRQVEKPQWFGLSETDEIDDVLAQIEEIEAQARTLGRSLLEHTLKTTLEQPGTVSLVLGSKRIDQVELLIKAIEE